MAHHLRMEYRNWRGETSERTIIPERLWYGVTQWHPVPCWLLSALDVEKGEMRDFALAECKFIPEEAQCG